MFNVKDLELHIPQDVDFNWGETHYFGWYLPEERIFANIYQVARPGVGAQVSDIVVYGFLTEKRWGAIHYDVSEHLPLVESYLDYKLPNGMAVKCVKPPRDYRIDYTGRNGTEFHLDYHGLMDPFDIHDADVNVRAQATKEKQEEHSGFGAGYRGHYDMTCEVKGEVVLGGRRFQVDCVDTIDHSWGPRQEHDMRALCWVHAHFGKDLTAHMILHRDPFGPPEQEYSLAHGYVLRNGVVHPIVSADVRAARMNGLQAVSMDAHITDTSGQTLDIQGSAVSGGDWTCYLQLIIFNTLHRWVNNHGQVGWGVSQDSWGTDAVCERNLKAYFDGKLTGIL